MFKKKPNIKPLSPIRSSDRRKIADQIISNFDIVIPTSEHREKEISNEASIALSIGDIRNSLLPEGSLSARFTTTIGPDLNQVTGTVYVGAPAQQEQRVLWIKIEENLIPSVYTLWRHPQLVPLLHTPDLVLRKLQGGADLMTPGLARGPPFPSKAITDHIVAVASIERPSVPQVVGICEIDVASIQKTQGAKGRAVKGYHWVGDEIWAWSQGGNIGENAPEEIQGWDLEGEAENMNVDMHDMNLNNTEAESDNGGVPLIDAADTGGVESSYNEFVEGEEPSSNENPVIEREFSTKEIDKIFWDAILFGVHQQQQKHKTDSNHGLSFPIPQSLVISNLVLPYLPIWTTADATSLQIKKTSWKNAKKFIKALDKHKLLKSKDRDGGETVVTSIDFENSAFTSFIPYKLQKKETAGVGNGGGGEGKSSAAHGDDSIGQHLSKIALFKAKEQFSPIFKASNTHIKELLVTTELRQIVSAYFEVENLVSASNKRVIKLNPVLANAVFDGSSSFDHEVLAKGTVPRDALIDRMLQGCSPFWAILRNDETRDTAKAKSGPEPKVSLTYETRSGNKTVTKVSGLEVFYINPQLLADELQKACASSTSVGQLAGSSPKNPVQEILIQGPQKDVVLKALEKRGVQKSWINFVNKMKGGKNRE